MHQISEVLNWPTVRDLYPHIGMRPDTWDADCARPVSIAEAQAVAAPAKAEQGGATVEVAPFDFKALLDDPRTKAIAEALAARPDLAVKALVLSLRKANLNIRAIHGAAVAKPQTAGHAQHGLRAAALSATPDGNHGDNR